MSFKTDYRLRSFDPSNPGDTLAMNLMFYHPEVMQAKGYWQDGFDFGKIRDLGKIDQTLAKIDYHARQESHDLMYSVVDKLDHLVGWIWFYLDSRYPLPTRVQKELGLRADHSRIYQVSYQKLMSMGWPEALLEKVDHATKLHLHSLRSGVIVEGLSLALKKLKRDFAKLDKNGSKIAVYAYVSPGNIGSAKVLLRNGFAKYPKQYRYEAELNDLWVKII
ncbi:MAG: hypothetical protein WAV40_03470 [Microgenomates group bacterium]